MCARRASANRNLARSRFSCLRTRSCSQIRRTLHPAARNARETARSRSLLVANFGTQKSFRDFGTRPWRGHACQKHPSTNSATRSRRHTKSGEPRRRTRRRQPPILAVRNALSNRTSVLLLPVPRTRAIRSDRSRDESVSMLRVESLPVGELL